ncbi:MAG: hypothetical protein HC842_02485 [Cytophagales bacterium]|nr:hypothetical protein [Cytophagales bacterium]
MRAPCATTCPEIPIDCDGNHAPDGIVGPYREKEGSFYSIREIWAPVQIEEPRLSPLWDGWLTIENDFHYTSLKDCRLEWSLLDLPALGEPGTQTAVAASVTVPNVEIAPQEKRRVQLTLPKAWHQHDALQLRLFDPHGAERMTWTWPITRPGREVASITKGSSVARITQTEEHYLLSAGEYEIKLDKTTGQMRAMSRAGQQMRFPQGPRVLPGDAVLKTHSMEENKVIFQFEGTLQKLEYSLNSDGWLRLVYNYKPNWGEHDQAGITFDYAEEGVKSVRWMGQGPYRVYKNRLKGPQFGVHQKVYNNTITGYTWDYPEFKGYHADFYWADLETDAGTLQMATSTPGLFLHLFTPEEAPKPGKTTVIYPEGDLSFLHAIARVGTKFKEAKSLGPQSQKTSTNTRRRACSWLRRGDLFSGEIDQ